ncbi:MAG: VOC family protein, partial [Saprospiraceae bacterium]
MMSHPKTYGLTHISVAVKDLDRTVKCYQHVFDMEIMYREENFIQLTTPGSHDVIVFTHEKNDHHIGHSGGIHH